MITFLKKISWYYKKHKFKFIIILVSAIILNLLEIMPPLIIGKTIDFITAETLTVTLMRNILILFFVVIISIYLLTFLSIYYISQSGYHIDAILRKRLVKKYLAMSPSFYERNSSGDLMARITNDLRSVTMGTTSGIVTILDTLIYGTIILITMMVVVNPVLTIIALLPLPLLIVTEVKIGRKIMDHHMIAQEAFGKMNNNVLEVVEGVRVTRSYVQENEEYNDFKAMTSNYIERVMKVVRLEALFEPVTTLIVASSFIISFAAGAYFIQNDIVTLGEFITFNIYLNMMIWPMFAFGMMLDITERGRASLNRIEDVLYETDDVLLSDGAVKNNDVSFKNYSFTYPTSTRDNLRGIDLELKKGQTLGIVGKTGSGKTTFIKQFLKYYTEGNGSFIIDGKPIKDISKEELRDLIGYVPQENFLFSKTVRENILFGKENATDEELQAAIENSALINDLNNMSDGLETKVGEKGVALSGGQKQRISIARSLIKNPEILILDDALSAVDANTEAHIIDALKRTRKDKTTIIITHRLSAVEHADQIIVIDDGEIVQSGTHDELTQKDGWYKTQHEYFKHGGETIEPN